MPRFLALAAAGVFAAQAMAAAAQAEDRYGPPMAAQAQPPATGAAVALLAWPGKAAAPAPAPDVVQVGDAAAPVALPTSLYAPPPPPMARHPKLRGVVLAGPAPSVAPVAAQPAVPMPPPPAPMTLAPQPPVPLPAPVPMPAATAAEPPAPPTAAPAQTADAAGHSAQTPRFYSVAREYGVQPDPDPLPAQFFADTQGSDMAAPPPPLDPRAVPGTQAATSPANTASNRARQVAIVTADAGADGPTGGAGGN